MTEDDVAEVFGGFAAMMDEEERGPRRYFPATAMAGRLYVQGVPDRGPWDPAGLVYWTERQVDAVVNPRAGSRKAETAGELDRGIRAAGFPSARVWIAEGLEDVVKARFQGTDIPCKEKRRSL